MYTNTSGESEPRNCVNEGVINIPHISVMKTPRSDAVYFPIHNTLALLGLPFFKGYSQNILNPIDKAIWTPRQMTLYIIFISV